MIQDKITLREAAELAGVSKVTLWRMIQKGELEASQDDKSRYTLERVTVLKCRETFQRNATGEQKRFSAGSETGGSPPETAHVHEADVLKRFRQNGETFQNVSANADETLGTDEKRYSAAPETVYETVEMVSSDLHRLALESARHALESARRAEERADRADRQMEMLSGQLIQYQRALQERAESLAEKEAMAKQAELLAEESAQRLSLYEQEKQQWQQELETTQTRINWLEKKVPRWVRGLFGAR